MRRKLRRRRRRKYLLSRYLFQISFYKTISFISRQIIKLTVFSMIYRICMPSYYHLLYRHHQCQEWEGKEDKEGMALHHRHHIWVEWGCHQCLLLACLHWATLTIDSRGDNFGINFTGEARWFRISFFHSRLTSVGLKNLTWLHQASTF